MTRCDRCDTELEETLAYIVGHNHVLCMVCVRHMVGDAVTDAQQTSLYDL